MTEFVCVSLLLLFTTNETRKHKELFLRIVRNSSLFLFNIKL